MTDSQPPSPRADGADDDLDNGDEEDEDDDEVEDSLDESDPSLHHWFWFVPRRCFFKPPTAVVSLPKKSGGIGASCVLKSDQNISACLLSPDVPVPRFQVMQDNNLLKRKRISLKDVFSKKYQHRLAVVSHRWNEHSHPDNSGSQLRKIKDFLQRFPHIKMVWVDWLCMPQDHGGPVPRTPKETEYFLDTLKKCHWLFLGLAVFVIWDENKSSSRFWPCLESWYAMQDTTPKGMQLPATDCLRLHLACAGTTGLFSVGRVSNSGGHNRAVAERLKRALGSLSVSDVLDRLGRREFAVTSALDKTLAMQSLECFDQDYKRLYSKLVGYDVALNPKSVSTCRAGGGALLKQFINLEYETVVCHCARQGMGQLDDPNINAGKLARSSRANFMCSELPPPLCAHCSGECDCPWKGPFLHLLEMQVDINAQSMHGETPLLAAAKLGQVRLAVFLMSQRADVEKSADQNDWTPLHEAAKLGRVAMCNVLLGHWGHGGAHGPTAQRPSLTRFEQQTSGGTEHADGNSSLANLRSKSGSTPLLEAAGGDSVEIIQQMIECGGDLNLRLPDGTTALMKAAVNGAVETCRVLVEGGSYLCEKRCQRQCRDPRNHRAVVDHNTRSAAALALELTRENRRFTEVVKFLNKRGAK